MTDPVGSAGDGAITLELRTGGAKAILGVLVLAIAVAYSTFVFLPVIPGPALAIWGECYGALIAAWLASTSLMIARLPSEEAVVRFWLPVVKALGTGSNLLAAVSIWLFLPYADPDLRAFMAILYVWYIVIQVMAETSASSVSASAIILVLGSLALYEFSHPTRYSVALGFFVLLFAASMLSFRRLIRRALMQALEARLQAERSNIALDTALHEVGEQRDAIRRFLAAASHDLQQPVQAASLFFDQAIGASNPASRTRAIEGARRAFASTQSMLQSMLEHLRLESGALRPRTTPVRIAELLHSVAIEHEAGATAVGMRIVAVPSRFAVQADPEMLRRILGNLITNSIRHSGAKRLLIGARRSADTISVMVIDDGCGVAPDDHNRIFDDYVSGAGESPGGNFGLGLSTSRRFARAMGGELTLENRWKNGACFILDLPAVETAG